MKKYGNMEFADWSVFAINKINADFSTLPYFSHVTLSFHVLTDHFSPKQILVLFLTSTV